MDLYSEYEDTWFGRKLGSGSVLLRDLVWYVQQNTRIYVSQNLKVSVWLNEIIPSHSQLEAFIMAQRNSHSV